MSDSNNMHTMQIVSSEPVGFMPKQSSMCLDAQNIKAHMQKTIDSLRSAVGNTDKLGTMLSGTDGAAALTSGSLSFSHARQIEQSHSAGRNR